MTMPQNRSKFMKANLFALLVMIGAAIGYGQETEAGDDNRSEDVSVLEEIVVAGTRTEKTVFDTPVQTEVITAESIEQSGADSLSEVFDAAGLQYAETGMGSHIQLQGMDGERILFLIDGKRVTGRVASNIVASAIPVNNIERIEIIRGPQSALYGSEALGGVINIITKRPESALSGGFSMKNSMLPISRGSDPAWMSVFREQTATGDIDVPLGPVSNRLSLSFSHAFPYKNENDISQYPGLLRGQGTLRSDIPVGNFAILKLGGEYSFDASKEITSRSGSFNGIDTHRANSSVSFDSDIGDAGLLKAMAYYNFFFRDKKQYSALSDSWFNNGQETEHFASSEVQFSQRIGEHNELTTVASYSYDQLTKYNIQGSELQERHTVALVLQDEQFTKGSYSVLGGIRGEYSNDYGIFFCPKFSGMIHIGDSLRLLASGGLGYRAPSFLELYLDSAGDIYHKYGNPDLKPEKSVSVNAGIEFFPRFLNISVNAFHSELFDEIVYDYTDQRDQNGLQIIKKENLARSSRTGADTSLRAVFFETVSLQLRYGFLFAFDRSTNTIVYNQPAHTVSGKIIVNIRAIELTSFLEGKFQSPHEHNNQSVFTLNAYVEKTLGTSIGVFIGADNITGASDSFAILLAGPVIYAGVKGKF